MKHLLIAMLMVGCSGPMLEAGPDLHRPSPVVEDCTHGCGTLMLDVANTDVSYLVGADTKLRLDLGPNLCTRLSVPENSASIYLADGSSWQMNGCQVIDNRNVYGKRWGITAGPAGLASWLRVETDTASNNDYCGLSCTP